MKYYIMRLGDVPIYPQVYRTDDILVVKDSSYPIYRVKKGAKMDDVMSCNGLLFSSKTMEILQKFQIDRRFIISPIVIKYGHKKLIYTSISSLTFAEGKTVLDWCDYEKNQFEVFSFFKKVQDISLSCKEDWINFRKLHDPQAMRNFHLRFKGKLVLKEEFYKEEFDFIYWDSFLSRREYVLSERLADALIDAGISGYEFKFKEIPLG